MKKMRMLALFLTMVLLMAPVVTAATTETDSKLDNGKVSIEVIKNEGVTTKLAYGFVKKDGVDVKTEEKITVTVTSTALNVDDQVLILMCKPKADETPDVADGNVYFIDQKAVTVEDTITFDVYPSDLKDSIIYISGVKDGLLKAVMVDGIDIGDADEDGVITIHDVIKIANYLVGNTTVNKDAADTDKDGGVSIHDVIKLANYLVGNTTLG